MTNPTSWKDLERIRKLEEANKNLLGLVGALQKEVASILEEVAKTNTFWACKTHTHNNTLRCALCDEARIKKLEAESKGRMLRIEKLVRLCHEYEVPFNEVLDTGLEAGNE